MGKLVLGAVLLFLALLLRNAAATVGGPGRLPTGGLLRTASLGATVVGALLILASTLVVIGPGTVGVQHYFGYVNPGPLLPGIRFVWPWSSVERFSTREEPFPETDRPEQIAALSSEQMGMAVEVALRWQIDPRQAPRIFTEIGNEAQIHNAVRNAIRNGVRDGMVQFSINDIAQRNIIAAVMEREVDSALVTRPRAGGDPFRIASVTAFFLRDLQPPPQVVQAINNKIAQEQQIQTERHRVEVARLQAEQQRLLNQTLTPEALTKQYLEVLEQMRTSNNLVLLVPTEGGLPVLNLGELRRNLRQP
ncbi:MAG TPA: SPFH domain-containing protein [Gemmatimonadales bacterium]|nr:SPFH domain-containing protein [Gemmatimonadales bacterium]